LAAAPPLWTVRAARRPHASGGAALTTQLDAAGDLGSMPLTTNSMSPATWLDAADDRARCC
jgi:hypothetical protein